MSFSFSVRSLVFSAFRAGGLRSVLLRTSTRARSGTVVVAVFACPVRAGGFARRWAGRLGLSVFVRRHPGGFAVSVPVKLPHTRLPIGAGRLLPVSGGLRGLLSVLASSGLGVC